MKLSIGEIISIVVAIGFGILNIIQYYNKKGVLKPISNSLIGLFNDVKDKLILAWGEKNRLWNQSYPYKEGEEVKWDYDSFIFTMIESLYGFQEHIVATLKTLEVSDDKVFQAITFGLSKEEKEQREIFMKKVKEEQETQLRQKQEQKTSEAGGNQDSESPVPPKLEKTAEPENRLSDRDD
ncbi:MAG TPA: hypothetical protein VMW42_09705 [Desulfatiglandales bacterium]|nr:hypothetical protein [Desulfatiglandales bacterium]